jgi:glutamyl-tRNA reductase
MSVLVVGLSHRSAPVEVLERAAVVLDELPKLLDEVLGGPHVSEVMLLTTCNRVEVYAVVDAFHGGLADVSDVLSRHTGMTLSELTEHVYVHYSAAAVQHLFAVAAGLDSMVVGEAQILGQLRSAYATADEVGTVGRVLHELAQQALRVGKRVHASTGIDSAGASVVSEALTDAAIALGTGDRGAGLAGRRAVVVGAGAMGGLAAAHLRRSAAVEVVVLNRTPERAARLAALTAAAGLPARSGGLDGLADEIGAADVVIACTGAVGVVISQETLAAAMAARAGRPLVVCDLGLPRDVDPSAAGLPGVTLIDLAALQRRLGDGESGAAVTAAQELVAEEAQAYLAAQRSAEVTPTVTALRRRASEVIDGELLRLDSRLPELPDRVREEFARSVRRVVDKLLHTPTVQVKRLAGGPDGDSYAAALRALFELDPQTSAAVAIQRSGDVLGALEARLDSTRTEGEERRP